ncbi:unnamed protein product [Clavelina lepadiformis]|uniref:Uncharacterized protein n=1 Tax=Clavelina lepadiformis TaxID=159417 RepID=A0ABP0GE84_CLALP
MHINITWLLSIANQSEKVYSEVLQASTSVYNLQESVSRNFKKLYSINFDRHGFRYTWRWCSSSALFYSSILTWVSISRCICVLCNSNL